MIWDMSNSENELNWLKRRNRRLQDIDYYGAKLKEGIVNTESPLESLERALAIAEAKADRLERIYSRQLISERKNYQYEIEQLKKRNKALEDAIKNQLDTKDNKIIEMRAKGYTMRAIASELSLSDGTVNSRIKKLRNKGFSI